MKKIRPIKLKDANILSDNEMKQLFGGSSAGSCACVLLIGRGSGSNYYRQIAPIIMAHPNKEGCLRGCLDECLAYPKSGEIECVGIDCDFG